MNASGPLAALTPHRIIMTVVFVGALAAGWAMLPGDNERIAMLQSDGHSREALAILEEEYKNGDRRYRTLYQMQLLYESEGNIGKAREVLEAMVLERPRDITIRNRLAQFYKSAEDKKTYAAALKSQIDLKYSEPACRELVALLRSDGRYDEEQSALQSCKQKGYRKPDDLSRLAELVATDGDSAQATALLKSIDDLKRLKSTRERYQLLTLLLEQDLPKEAERRALRWIKASKDDTLSIGLIEILAHSKHPASAIEVAKDSGAPGDSISLTVAERLIEQAQVVPAQLYLKGWLDKSLLNHESLALRFVEAAMAVSDPTTALLGARKYGLERLPPSMLTRLAAQLSNAGLAASASEVFKAAGSEAAPVNPEAQKPVAVVVPDGPVTDERNASPARRNTAGKAVPVSLQPAASDPLDVWRRTLWFKMSDDAARRAQALGLTQPTQGSSAGPSATNRGGRGGIEVRSEQRSLGSAKFLNKTSRVLQRTKRIRSLGRKTRPQKDTNHAGQLIVPAPAPVLKPQPYP